MWPIMDEHKLVRRIPITNGTGTHRAPRSDKGGKHNTSNTVYRIESDIPIPPRSQPNRDGGLMAALRRMEIGQSFFVPAAAKEKTRRQANLSGMARSIRDKGNPIKVVTRQIAGGVRVWRVA